MKLTEKEWKTKHINDNTDLLEQLTKIVDIEETICQHYAPSHIPVDRLVWGTLYDDRLCVDMLPATIWISGDIKELSFYEDRDITIPHHEPYITISPCRNSDHTMMSYLVNDFRNIESTYYPSVCFGIVIIFSH